MQVVVQKLDDILASLQPLTVDWQDDISRRVIAEIETMPVKTTYVAADVQAILDRHFDDGLLICETNRMPRWSDVLVERLRSGRGSAISGQRRGRGVEDFAEAIVKEVFGDQYSARCTLPVRAATPNATLPSRRRQPLASSSSRRAMVQPARR